MFVQPSQRLLQCWGKTLDEHPEVFHPALYHMIDVGQVARVFLGEQVSKRWTNLFARLFSGPAQDLPGWLPWAVAVHDLGKISAAFQSESDSQAERLRRLGFSLPADSSERLKHPIIGQVAFTDELAIDPAWGLLSVLPWVIGGHHGSFPAPGARKDARRRIQRDEPLEWQELRRETNQTLQTIFLLNPAAQQTLHQSAAIMALTGFTILCDWIGSNSDFFPPAPQEPFERYLALSRDRAVQAVQRAGFFLPEISEAPTTFSALFADIAQPRPLQAAVDAIPDAVLRQPCLVVIEGPTGEGKTETALAVAHRIAHLQGSDEFYYALPTTATSNQMYGRVQAYLNERLHLETPVRLVHSQAFLRQDQVPMRPTLNGEKDPQPALSLDWFSPKKRALLAPFGVGTVDQTELGALNVPHHALRLVGLAGKTLILDEVHAYDAYMTTILGSLLGWLSALGASVILLSATLPRSRREQLARAFGAALPEEPQALEHYPLLYAAAGSTVYTAAPPAQQTRRTIALHWLHFADDDPRAKARWLLDQVGARGCWCWICNTVQRAQQLFQALDDQADPHVLRILIHSRFSAADRERIEAQLQNYFGPTGDRPMRAVVIGTQVLEQSLDLDFDGMVSDLAPVDLLLQRAGRLHRHLWRKPQDRGAHVLPHFYLYQPTAEDGQADYHVDRRVYAEYILRKTAQVVAPRGEWVLPGDYRTLIAAVYDAPPPGETDPLYPAWKDMQDAEAQDAQEARLRLLPDPDPQFPFCTALDLSFQEDEDRAGWLVARTRLGEESLTVLPLEKLDGQTAICAGLSDRIALDRPASPDMQLALRRAAIKISGDDLCAAVRLAAGPELALFHASAGLRHVIPLWLLNGQSVLAARGREIHLKLDSRLGLWISRSKGRAHDGNETTADRI